MFTYALILLLINPHFINNLSVPVVGVPDKTDQENLVQHPSFRLNLGDKGHVNQKS